MLWKERDGIMMWKESYRLGIDKIDQQHKMLFDKTGELIQEIEGQQRVEIYRQMIGFLREYVVIHFRDEESYFESIGFEHQDDHKRQHRELTEFVAEYAAKLEQTQYALPQVKELAGMLSAWLVYHVVKEDLKYAEHGTKCQEEKPKEGTSYLEHFTNSTIQVLETMVGIDPSDVSQTGACNGFGEDEIFVEVGLVGELKGKIIFGFTKDFSKQMVKAMMLFTPEEIDELVCSVLAEVSNIASGNGTIAISSAGTACNICPPKILHGAQVTLPPKEKIQINTKIGKMTIAVYLDQ